MGYYPPKPEVPEKHIPNDCTFGAVSPRNMDDLVQTIGKQITVLDASQPATYLPTKQDDRFEDVDEVRSLTETLNNPKTCNEAF